MGAAPCYHGSSLAASCQEMWLRLVRRTRAEGRAMSLQHAPRAGTKEPLSFGELLKQYRLAAGLTQEALAERAGLSVREISDLERGVNRAPRPDTLQLLAAAL